MTAYRGTPVSEGVAAGRLYLPETAAGSGTEAAGVTAGDVRAAFAAVAAERSALAGRLRAAGRDHEAEIVEIGALIAADPALSGPALAALAGRPAPLADPSGDQAQPGTVRDNQGQVPAATAAAAITAAAEAQASILQALPDPDLAQRAGDVRQVAAAVAARLAGAAAAPPPDGPFILVGREVASAAETRLGLANGAAGVGLLRTEIPFTRASGWPSREEHLAALAPVLRLLGGRRAVVRLLDFAGDKVPWFPGAAGLTAFLHAPGALAAQLAAILDAGAGTDLAVMIPMVRSLDEVDLVRLELAKAAKAAGVAPPPLGMMVELAATALAAPAFAGGVDFFSIGTNDLTADVLRRARAALRPAAAARPEVLAAIAATVRAARQADIGLSVCGDAAADPAVLPRLIAMGVRTVSGRGKTRRTLRPPPVRRGVTVRLRPESPRWPAGPARPPRPVSQTPDQRGTRDQKGPRSPMPADFYGLEPLPATFYQL